MDFLLICEDRLNPCYFSLHSGMEALSWSQENKPAATVQWPKSLVCRDEDSGEQGSNSSKDHQGEDHSTQSLSKASHLLWIQHRTPWWSTRTKKAGIQTKHLLSSGFSTEQNHLKAQKHQDPQSRKQKCAIQNHTDVNLTFKGLYITKKHKSQWMCKIHSMRLVSSLLGKLLFSSLFPAYCWKRDCQNNDTSS